MRSWASWIRLREERWARENQWGTQIFTVLHVFTASAGLKVTTPDRLCNNNLKHAPFQFDNHMIGFTAGFFSGFRQVTTMSVWSSFSSPVSRRDPGSNLRRKSPVCRMPLRHKGISRLLRLRAQCRNLICSLTLLCRLTLAFSLQLNGERSSSLRTQENKTRYVRQQRLKQSTRLCRVFVFAPFWLQYP